MLLEIANDLNALFVIDVFKIAPDDDKLHDPTLDILQNDIGWVHWIPPTDDKTEALSVLYDRLFEHIKPRAGVFVGGAQCMRTAWSKLLQWHPDGPTPAICGHRRSCSRPL